jgi:hypothetical protein
MDKGKKLIREGRMSHKWQYDTSYTTQVLLLSAPKDALKLFEGTPPHSIVQVWDEQELRRTDDLLALEYQRPGHSGEALRENKRFNYVEIMLGVNIFRLHRSCWPDEITQAMLDWTPARHAHVPARVWNGTLTFLKCLKRMGIYLDAMVRQRIVRAYVYADVLYMKAMHEVSHMDNDRLRVTWESARDSYKSSYRRGTLCDMRICVAQQISTRGLFANTIYFGDTCDDRHDSNVDTHIRNAFMLGNYGVVSEHFKFPYPLYEENQFYVHLYENSMCYALLGLVGHQLLSIEKMGRHVYWVRYNETAYQHVHRFLIDLARLKNDWQTYQTYATLARWDPSGIQFALLLPYLCERGGGWYSNSDLLIGWRNAWRHWTPEAHADPANFSLNFRYRARPILSLVNVGGKIVRWMAAATWITHQVSYPPLKNKHEKMEYLARYRIYPKQSIRAHELDALVLETRRMVSLLCMK